MYIRREAWVSPVGVTNGVQVTVGVCVIVDVGVGVSVGLCPHAFSANMSRMSTKAICRAALPTWFI
jgi:hypothetical protein